MNECLNILCTNSFLLFSSSFHRCVCGLCCYCCGGKCRFSLLSVRLRLRLCLPLTRPTPYTRHLNGKMSRGGHGVGWGLPWSGVGWGVPWWDRKTRGISEQCFMCVSVSAWPAFISNRLRVGLGNLHGAEWSATKTKP